MTLRFTGDNTYTGGTDITGGTLIINSGTTLNTSGDINANATTGTATLTVTGANTVLDTGTGKHLWLGTNGSNGNLNVMEGATVAIGSTLSAADTGSSSTSTVLISGANSHVSVAHNFYVGYAGSAVATVEDGGTLTINSSQGGGNGSDYFNLSLNSTGSGAGTFNLNTNGTLEVGGTNGIRGGYALISNAGATFNANGGTIKVINRDLSTQSNMALGDDTTSTINTNGLNANFFGVLSGTGGLTKTNTGTLNLTEANTYTGVTTVSAGTLLNNGSLASVVNVASGATLGGDGTFDALAAIASGAQVAPGNASPLGTITFNGGLTLDDGAILDLRLGTTSDLIVVSGGTLTGSTGDGGIIVNLTDSGDFAAGTYTLIDATGATLSSISATTFELGTTIAGYTYAFAQSGNQFQLIAAAAIPEPATALLGLLSLGFVASQRRRIRSNA